MCSRTRSLYSRLGTLIDTHAIKCKKKRYKVEAISVDKYGAFWYVLRELKSSESSICLPCVCLFVEIVCLPSIRSSDATSLSILSRFSQYCHFWGEEKIIQLHLIRFTRFCCFFFIFALLTVRKKKDTIQ